MKGGAVMIMVELISDEEDDDDLSNKAYQASNLTPITLFYSV